MSSEIVVERDTGCRMARWTFYHTARTVYLVEYEVFERPTRRYKYGSPAAQYVASGQPVGQPLLRKDVPLPENVLEELRGKLPTPLKTFTFAD